MRWQITQFIFCDQQQSLTSTNDSVQLEPMMVELLSYFCQNPDQIISKDLLIEKVWLGRIVSDNAVSKLITKLRKVFSDDARQPKFIATFPKKGYKFIADVMLINDDVVSVEINENESQNQDEEKPLNSQYSVKGEARSVPITESIIEGITEVRTEKVNSPKAKDRQGFYITLLVIIISIITFITQKQQTQKTASASTHTKTITTDSGDELFPNFSPEGTRVAYMSAKNDRMHLMLKNVVDERIIEISHGKDVGVGPADWSDDGKVIVY